MPPPTLVSSPTTPRSLYRPIQYTYGVNPPTPVAITFVRVATSGDVVTYPTLIEGESIIVEHASLTGFLVGQHMIIQGAGEWNGVRKVREILDSTHTVIDGAGFDAVTAGTIGIYRNNHKFLVYLWHDISETSPRAVLKVDVNDEGQATFSVNTVLQSWINSDLLHAVSIADLTSTGFISAEYLSSVIFRLQVIEGYDVPNADGINVWTLFDQWDPLAGTPKAAINGVHPYDHEYPQEANAQLDWSTSSLSAYQLGGSAARFLTYAPRTNQKGAAGEKGRAVLINPAPFSGDTYDLRLFATPFGGTAIIIGTATITIPAGISSFAIPTGLTELEALTGETVDPDVYESYSVYLTQGDFEPITEVITIQIDTKCSEVRRRFHWLNKLGGIDSYSFTRREIASNKIKRSVLSKPYGATTGYDYRQRVYRTEPSRNFAVSSEQVKPKVRQWLVEDLLESANVLTSHGSTRLSTVIFSTDGMESFSTEDRKSQIVLNYAIGVDNISQES